MPLILSRGDEQFVVEDRLPVLPLRDVVVFPHMVIPLLVGRSASMAAVEEATSKEGALFVVAQKNADVQEPVAADLFRVGVVARVLQLQQTPSGTTKVLLEGVGRARVTRYSAADRSLRATLGPLALAGWEADVDARGAVRRVVSQFEEYVALHGRI